MEVSQTVDVTSEETESDDSSNSSKSGKKQRVGFRDRKIIDYENRIRTYSTPDKIFRYFATFQSIHSGEVRTKNLLLASSLFQNYVDLALWVHHPSLCVGGNYGESWPGTSITLVSVSYVVQTYLQLDNASNLSVNIHYFILSSQAFPREFAASFIQAIVVWKYLKYGTKCIYCSFIRVMYPSSVQKIWAKRTKGNKT